MFRGPQSPLFGNYATGGAIAFRTRTGREIDGYEIGVDAGSFGYLSNYFTVGGVSDPFEISLFASDVRANGYQDHASYDTQTINLLASYTPTPDNRFTLKVINNTLDANLPARASLAQYRINPYQRGCAARSERGPGLHHLQPVPERGIRRDRAGDGRRGRLRAQRPPDHRGRPLGSTTSTRSPPGARSSAFDERNFDQPFY